MSDKNDGSKAHDSEADNSRANNPETTTPKDSNPPKPLKKAGSLVAFNSRDFTLFWFAAIISNSAQWMQQVTVPFIVFDMTDSNSWVGLVSFALLIPALLLTPLAGVLADRFPRTRILIYTTSTQFLVAMGFMYLWQTDTITPFWILGLSLIQGMSAGLQIANWQSLVPQLVPEKHLFSAIRLNSTQFTAARAFGPLGGTLLLGTLGAGAVFLTNALTYLVLFVTLLLINPRIYVSENISKVTTALKEGYQYVTARKAIIQAVLSAFMISFFGQSLVQLAAGLASEHYDVGEFGLGGFITASGIGTIIGSGVLILFADNFARSKTVMFGLFLYAVGPVLTGSSTIYIIGMLGYFVSGIAHMAVAISVNTALQSQLTEDIRGRVISFYLMGIFAGIPLGALLGGRLGDVVGLEKIFVAYGIGLALYAFLVLMIYRGHKLLDYDTDTLSIS